MLVEFAYTLQINLNKDNLDAIDSAARKLGFLDIEEMCKQVVEAKNSAEVTLVRSHLSPKNITLMNDLLFVIKKLTVSYHNRQDYKLGATICLFRKSFFF